MNDFIARAWHNADYVMLAAFAAFWLRWELWQLRHRRQHRELEERVDAQFDRQNQLEGALELKHERKAHA